MSSDEDKEETFDSTDPIVLRALVTGPEAGSIIGKKGESINNIRDESKAKVNIFGDGKEERLISVEGKTHSIFKAYTMICKVLESRDKDGGGRNRNRSGGSTDTSGDITLKLLIPTVQAGAIIGKGGENIKDMRSSSGADVNFNADPLQGSTEREFRICGKREQVTKCIFSVVSILLENPPKGGDVRLYQPNKLTEERRERDRGRDRMMREDRGYIFDDRMGDRLGGGGYGGGGGYSGGGGRPSAWGDRRSRRDDSPPRMGGGGGMGGMAATHFNIISDFARSHSSSRGSSSGRRPSSRDANFELYVKNDQVGAVIGNRGVKINEIRQLSGAFINVTEASGRSSETDRERKIVISGSVEQVALAKSLINVAIELGDGGRDRGGDGNRRSNFDRSRSRERGDRYDRRW